MGQKKYPPIAQRDFAAILRRLFGRGPDHCRGDHEYFVGKIHGKPACAQNDTGCDPVYDWPIPDTIAKCGVTREQFYGMLKSTARSARCDYIKEWNP